MLVTDDNVDPKYLADVLVGRLKNVTAHYVVHTRINVGTNVFAIPLNHRTIKFDTYEKAIDFATNFEALDPRYSAKVTTIRRGELT